MILIRNMTEQEYDMWIEESIQQQAIDRANTNHISLDVEILQLRQLLPKMLPNGVHTPFHHFYSIDLESKTNIGFLWFSPLNQTSRDSTFLTDIMIKTQYRSQGIGRKALDLAHTDLKAHGYKYIELYVLHNNYAKNLYKSMGYHVIHNTHSSSLMRKHF